jgi:hypothetical protein
MYSSNTEYEDTKECWESTDITEEMISDKIDSIVLSEEIDNLERFLDSKDMWAEFAEYLLKKGA